MCAISQSAEDSAIRNSRGLLEIVVLMVLLVFTTQTQHFCALLSSTNLKKVISMVYSLQAKRPAYLDD